MHTIWILMGKPALEEQRWGLWCSDKGCNFNFTPCHSPQYLLRWNTYELPITHTYKQTHGSTHTNTQSISQSYACMQTFSYYFCLLKSQVHTQKDSSLNILKTEMQTLSFLEGSGSWIPAVKISEIFTRIFKVFYISENVCACVVVHAPMWWKKDTFFKPEVDLTDGAASVQATKHWAAMSPCLKTRSPNGCIWSVSLSFYRTW